MILSYDATPQVFITGRILKAEEYNYKEMFIRVYFLLSLCSCMGRILR